MNDKAFVDMKFANGMVCPHCESKGKGVTRNGKSETGRQRYLCKHCGKRFTVSTNGVSTKHLNNYHLWNNFLNYAKETTSQKMSILINHVLTTNCYTRVEEISQRPALPLVA